jgi:phosphatidylinositol glycan class F
MVYPAVGVALGSWTGAFPIALDWDRPWQVYQIPNFLKSLSLTEYVSQAWPLTPAFGAILGYIAGALGAVVVSAV